MRDFFIFGIVYFIFISLISSSAVVYDKRSSQKGRRRIAENSLMLLGLLGGAFSMLLTMKKIRHKTKHKKFMIGLPAEIILHITLLIFFVFKMDYL